MAWIWIACFVLLVLALGSLGMFIFIFVRRAVPPYDTPEALDASRWRAYRAPLYRGICWLREHQPETVTIESCDGLRLAAQFIPHANPRGALILLHGYRSSPNIDLTAGLSRYYAMGLSLLVCDQRAHGASEGRIITMGLKERYDAKAWAEYLARRLGRETPLYLGGISMGATTVLMAADLPMEANVRGIIADCGFTAPGDIVRYLIRRNYHLPAKPLAALLNLSCRLIGGFGLDQWSTVRSMERAGVPVLFFHGEADHFVPKEMTEAAYTACTSPKKLLEFPDAGHGLSFLVEPDRYVAALREFIDGTIGV